MAIQKESGGTSLKIDFSSGDTSSDLNGLFSSTSTREMFEGEE